MSEQSLSKIAVYLTADQALSRMWETINKDFEGGRVTKAGLASWIVHEAERHLDDRGIDDIRKAHFNQVAYLENLVKRLKSSNQTQVTPEDLAPIQNVLPKKGVERAPRAKGIPVAASSQISFK